MNLNNARVLLSSRKQWQTPLNSSPPGQNGRHFAHDICRCIFVNENFFIVIKISPNFVPEGPIKFFQLWRSSRHSRLPHGREQQIIEQPALPAGRMYSLPTAGLEYIMSIAINSLLLYWFHVTPMSLSSHYSYKSPVYLNPNFIPLWWIFLTYKYQLSPRVLHFS